MDRYVSKGTKIVIYAFLIIIAFITLIPLLYTFSAALKTNFEIAQGGANLIPKEPTWDNLKQVWGMGGSNTFKKSTYADYSVNSLIISTLSTALIVIMTSMSAYCFERGNFPGRNALYWTFLSTMFIGAGTVTIFPIMQITSKFGLNNMWGLILVESSVAGASNLFLTMGYLKTISKELDDAARIDGCTFFSTWYRIILPLSKPILATVALMSFTGVWNDYLLPTLMLATKPDQITLIVAVTRLQSAGGAGASQYNLMMAGTVLTVLPVLVLFIVMNKQFVAGITQGAVKG